MVAPSRGGRPVRVTSLAGDERWPSWTADNRILFAHRGHSGRWRLHAVSATGGQAEPLFPDTSLDNEQHPRVSPDGDRVAYVSDRESDDGEVELWIADLDRGVSGQVQRTRLTRVRGAEAYPSWAPDGSRIAYYAIRENVGAVWALSTADASAGSTGESLPGRRPVAPPVLVSRQGGAPAWSPDGRRIAIANLPLPDATYNGNPDRNADDPPPLFAHESAFRLWMVEAPLPVDAGAREIAPPAPAAGQFTAAFDRVWQTLARLYYSSGPSADAWRAARDRHRPEAQAARDEAQLESAVDAMIASQPLIKPLVTSTRAVVVTGHPLASRAAAAALDRGGNIVDAAVAASFALGVVEPEASGIGGDGMAVLYLKGMAEPVAIDFKDQVPIQATRDNPRLQPGGSDGPAAANIPGVVAGLDLLHRKYGSGRVAWADLIEPAIEHAEKGYELDEALPTSIAEGRRFFEKYPAAARIYLPGGRVPRPGDRFVNADYGATLRAIAREGASSFYRGSIARRIADDMSRNGGIITLDDLAQYRAIERRPLSGRYRDHVVFSSPPPVATGAALIETLQILQNYGPPAKTPFSGDADYLHHVIEAWKVRDQGPRIADPAFWDVDLGSHLDAAHAAGLFRRIDPRKASRDRSAGDDDGPAERIGRGTTAFAVADSDGNMIAVTQTLSTWGGTFYVSEGLGFLYNNHLRFNRNAGAGRFLPLARSSSTNVPTLVFRAPGSGGDDGPGEPRLAVAAAGNAWIPASVYGIILAVVDGGMSAQHAVEAPRLLVVRDPSTPGASRVQIEDRFPRRVLDDLAARGHRFQKIGRKGEVRYGYAAAVVVDRAAGEVQGGAEPRRSHAAVAAGSGPTGQ
jgi:gamma-glutamyltranspeptidase